MRDTEREAETQVEGEVGSTQGALCGTRSGTAGSHPELKADAQPLSHPGAPKLSAFRAEVKTVAISVTGWFIRSGC